MDNEEILENIKETIYTQYQNQLGRIPTYKEEPRYIGNNIICVLALDWFEDQYLNLFLIKKDLLEYGIVKQTSEKPPSVIHSGKQVTFTIELSEE